MSFTSDVTNQFTRIKFGELIGKVDLKIMSNYVAEVTFTMMNQKYEFKILNWNTKLKIEKFALIFFDKFGDSPMAGLTKNGVMANMDQEIRMMIKYSVYDIFVCLQQIIMEQERSVIDYAMFFRKANEKYGLGPQTYEAVVHLIACHFLVHERFLTPGVQFDLVRFCEENDEFSKDNIYSWRTPRNTVTELIKRVDDLAVQDEVTLER